MPTLKISNTVSIDENEVEVSAIRASGSGGQKVNKVSAAIHLRFDIEASSFQASTKKSYKSLKTNVSLKRA